ncbi:MAG: RNA polymerase sigma factor RpoD/SigA [Cyanobacteria bacterium]|nr:RNA polymerase sigma factor RpoD/SigA [Cyanobacteriota bacterium]
MATETIHYEQSEPVSSKVRLKGNGHKVPGRTYDAIDILGLYITRVRGFETLSAKQERELIKAIGDGDKDAKDRLINANLRLVVKIAKSYNGKGLELMDLIQEGNIGLQKAIAKFSLEKGYRFGTYAGWWIREAITRSLSNKSRTVRIPVHLVELITKIRRLRETLTRTNGSVPTLLELAAATGVSVTKIEMAINQEQPRVSLDTCNQASDDDAKGGIQIGVIDNRAERKVYREHLRQEVNQLLKVLSKRERDVIRLRFGLDDEEEPLSLIEVAEVLRLSRDQVGKGSSSAMCKLRKALAGRVFRLDWPEWE